MNTQVGMKAGIKSRSGGDYGARTPASISEELDIKTRLKITLIVDAIYHSIKQERKQTNKRDTVLQYVMERVKCIVQAAFNLNNVDASQS